MLVMISSMVEEHQSYLMHQSTLHKMPTVQINDPSKTYQRARLLHLSNPSASFNLDHVFLYMCRMCIVNLRKRNARLRIALLVFRYRAKKRKFMERTLFLLHPKMSRSSVALLLESTKAPDRYFSTQARMKLSVYRYLRQFLVI